MRKVYVYFYNFFLYSMAFQNEFLKAENEKLKKQLEQLSEARNQEILDLQHHFAEQLKKLQAEKGISDNEELKKENESLKSQLKQVIDENVKLKQDYNELQEKLKKSTLSENSLRAEINHLKSQSKQEVKVEVQETPQLPDINELIEPYENQILELANVVKEKQAEITRLQGIIHQECEERIKLQAALGIR